MAKKKRDRRDDDRLETLADLTPERLKASESKRAAKRASKAAPLTAEEQADWDERVAAAESARSGRQTFAPLIVAAAAVLAVVAVILWSVLSSGEKPTVDALPTPVIAADGGGSAIYPENSAEAVRENVRFGFIPAVDLVELGDGTIVLGAGGPDAGEDLYGKPYAELSVDEFLEGTIPAPREDTNAGTPATWAQVYEEYGADAVVMPSVASEAALDAVLGAAGEAERIDAVIVRTTDDAIAQAAVTAGAVALFDGDAAEASPEDLADAGFGMVAVNADAENLDTWLGSDVGVWLTGVSSADQLNELSEAGALGALTADPFALQPSDPES